MRAAQYVRMSTEHQQYSIANQEAVISEYAKLHDFSVVRTYSDTGKSGLDLAHRPGLQHLLNDVINRTADFSVVLVYDVSRWGRFQDADESAHYEFLCKQGGVAVHYCAEQFANDNSVLASLFKAMKRTMAGEYSRELSEKVFAAQRRLTHMGFKMGGPAIYGLRRMLVDSDKVPERVLSPGQWKYLSTQHVIFVPGPEHEIEVVRSIYSMFLDKNMRTSEIVHDLNTRKIPKRNGYPWTLANVRKILSDPTYAGCAVFARTSKKLRSREKKKPLDQWLIQPDSFAALVPLDRVQRARQKLRSRFRTDEQILDLLRTYVARNGAVQEKDMQPSNGLPFSTVFRKRFGSILRSYQLAGIKPTAPMFKHEAVRIRFIRTCVSEEFRAALQAAPFPSQYRNGLYTIPGCQSFQFEVSRCVQTRRKGLRWWVYCRPGLQNKPCAVARLRLDNTVQDWCLLDILPPDRKRYSLDISHLEQSQVIRSSASELLSLLIERLSQS